MKNNELINIYGGISFTSAVLNSILKGVTTFYEIGRRVGSYLIRYKTNNLCSVN